MEDEPFESDFLDSWSLQREVVLGSLRGGEPAEAVYDHHIRRLQTEGGAPFGVFSEVEKGKNLKPIEAWVTYLRSCEGDEKPSTWRLGTSLFQVDQVDQAHPPLALTITLDNQPRRVELSGDLRVQLGGSLFLETGQPASSGKMAPIRRKALAAYIDHLVLTCLLPDHTTHKARFVFETTVKRGNRNIQELPPFIFPDLTRAMAEAQLRSWIEDLLTGDHAVLMPIEAVLAVWGKQDERLTPESILAYVDEELEKEERSYLSTLKGPVPDPTRFAPPPDPEALVKARLGAFLDVVFAAETKEQV